LKREIPSKIVYYFDGSINAHLIRINLKIKVTERIPVSFNEISKIKVLA